MKKITFLFLLVLFSTILISKNTDRRLEFAKRILISEGIGAMSEAFWEKQIGDSKYYDHPNLPDSVWVIVKNEMDEKDTFLIGMAEILVEEFSENELAQILNKSSDIDLIKRYERFRDESGDKCGIKAMELGRQIPGRITAFLKKKGYI